MRILSCLVIAALLTPGCAAALVPPAVGIAGGLALAAGEKVAGYNPRYDLHVLIGAAAGVVVDAVVFGIIVSKLSELDGWGDPNCPSCD